MERSNTEIIIADLRKTADTVTYEKLLSILPLEERNRAERFRFFSDKINCAAASVISRSYAIKEYGKSDILRTAQGKPYINGGFEFNISHTVLKKGEESNTSPQGIVIFARNSKPVGLDIETVKERNSQRLYSLFGDKVQAHIESASAPNEKFIEMWTIFESFAKAIGNGVSMLEKEYTIDLSNRFITYNGKQYSYRNFDYDCCKISICSENIENVTLHELTITDWHNIFAAFAAPS